MWMTDLFKHIILYIVLQGEVKLMSTELCDMQEKWEERQAEIELMKEQLAESMEQNHHLAHGVCLPLTNLIVWTPYQPNALDPYLQ